MLKHIALGIVLLAGFLAGTAWADEALNKALVQAVMHNDMNEIGELISKGADVNTQRIGGTPLHYAENKAVAELLISKGADVKAKNQWGQTTLQTTLHSATYLNYKEIAELLISKGVDVNSKDNDGNTPLHDAASYLKKDVTEMLLAHGADINAKNNDGETPLTLARQSNQDSGENKQAVIALLSGVTKNPAKNSRELLKQLLSQFSAENETLRKSIIELALKLKPPPAIPQEAEDAAGRAAYIFSHAKSEDDMLATAKEYLKAIELAPWVANYYFNLCTVLEKTTYTQQALHACKLYLEAAPNAADAADMRQHIAGLQFAVDKDKEKMKQRTAYVGHLGIEELYRVGGISGKVAGKDAAIKLTVDWQASPPKYQVYSSCFEAGKTFGEPHDLVSTDVWISVCPNTNFHLVIKPEGLGFVELGDGSGGSLRATLDELFKLKQKALEQSPLVYANKLHIYLAYLHGGRDKKYAGFAMYESDCNGNLLRQDLRALPDDFYSLESFEELNNKIIGTRFVFLTSKGKNLLEECAHHFARKTGYSFVEE